MKRLKNWFVFGLATVAFLAPLKFGTPVMIQAAAPLPRYGAEWFQFSWPNELIVIFIFAGFIWLVLDRDRMLARVDLLFTLPLFFLLTQALAVPRTICPQVTIDTLMLFAAGVLLFYVGAWYVRDGAATAQIFGGLALATLFVCMLAMRQHFGGFAETRAYAALYVDPAHAPKDFLLRMTSNRVFGSLVYPNALAGFIVVAFSPTLVWIWVRARSWDPRVKWVTLVFAGGVMLFCLVLTGSRGGFLAFGVMVLTVFVSWFTGGERQTTFWLLALVATLAVVFLLGQHAGFLHFGTTSLESRLDYWRGAVAIVRDHPWVGTGPGTFGSIYPKYKTALTEEAQVVHNNFLQMWSDSGVLAFVAYALLWIVAVRDAFRLARQRAGDAAAMAVCGALAGWTAHGLMDFDLYSPGVALPAFILLGIAQGLKELPRTDSVTSSRRREYWLVGAICAFVLAAVLWTEGRALAANSLHGSAQELAAVDPLAALDTAKQAADLVPWNSRLQSSVGDMAFLAGKPNEAITAYHQAIHDDPYRASGWWHLAEAKKAMHQMDTEVLGLLRKAVELNPTNKRYSQALAAAEESVRQSRPTLLESGPAKENGSSKQ
jgi:putative inorganic carbon (HCO3(-)) transporter